MKATNSEIKQNRQSMREAGETVKILLSEMKQELRRGRSYSPRLVKAMKNYRCCGFNCNKIIKKGNRHYMKMPHHPADSWWRACSIKCCATAVYVYSSNEIAVYTIRKNYKIAEDIDPKKLGYRVLYN